ncbi:MAG: hypothetical protein WKG07_32885 [Hymenobacter sp.]
MRRTSERAKINMGNITGFRRIPETPRRPRRLRPSAWPTTRNSPGRYPAPELHQQAARRMNCGCRPCHPLPAGQHRFPSSTRRCICRIGGRRHATLSATNNFPRVYGPYLPRALCESALRAEHPQRAGGD